MVVPPTRSTSTDSATSDTSSAEDKPPKKVRCTTVPATKGAGTALANVLTSPPLATKGDEESMDKSGDNLDIRSAEDIKAEETALLDLEPKESEETPVLPGPTEDSASQGSTLSGAWGGNASETANISEVEDLVMVSESRFIDSERSQDLAGLRDNADANRSTAPKAANLYKGSVDITATGNLTHTQKLNLRSAPIKPPSVHSDSSSESSADSFESAATQILNITKEASVANLRSLGAIPKHVPPPPQCSQ
jgi:hypothetical protein